MSDDLRKRLAEEIHHVDFGPLEPHAKRGGLMLVDPQLDLLDVAVAIAMDRSDAVRVWMEGQQLSRPTVGQLDGWRKESQERFKAVIVQPYVLVQADPEH
jgi:hypothetical protein